MPQPGDPFLDTSLPVETTVETAWADPPGSVTNPTDRGIKTAKHAALKFQKSAHKIYSASKSSELIAGMDKTLHFDPWRASSVVWKDSDPSGMRTPERNLDKPL